MNDCVVNRLGSTVKWGKLGQFSTSAMYFNNDIYFFKSEKNTVTISFIVVATSRGNTIKIGYKIFLKNNNLPRSSYTGLW